jgi:thioredoxin reductase
MSLVKKLMGRRQFLIATGIASGCALTCKKLAGFEHRAAMAAGKAASAAPKTANRCPHLLAPLKIRNRVLKNRIYHTVAPTYFMQGPENYPTEMYRNHYSNMAKNAAIVSVSTHFESERAQPSTLKASEIVVDNAFNHYSDCSWSDIPLTVNYINEMIDSIHYQGALILFAGNTGMGGMGGGMPGGGEGGEGAEGGRGGMPQGQGGEGGPQGGPGGALPNGGMPGGTGEGMPGGAGGEGGRMGGAPGGGGPPGMTAQTDEEIVADAQDYEKKGYDVYQLRSASAEAAKEIKATTNLILMGSLRGGGGGMPGQVTEAPTPQATKEEIEEGVEQARQFEGIADILWIRVDKHPNAWTQDKGRPKSLAYAEAIKKAKIDIITCPSAGFHDPVENDAFIAAGKTDMVGMTAPFFCDPELVRKVAEGRAEDVLPCIACQDCHGISMNNPPWYSTCAMNPTWGLPPYQLQGIKAPGSSKKVAVIGGGPAGMKAALIAAERGHKVTLYEKDKTLGGLLKISDNSKWRWNYKDLKDYYIRQVEKAGVEVKLNTAATPEKIKKAKYDTVLVATGAEVVTSKVKAGGTKVFNILEAYSKKDELGKEVVIIGAGKFGVEAGVGMLKDGHKVTVLALGNQLVEEKLRGAHNMMNQEDIYNNSPDFSYALGVTIKDISGGKVTYTDARGNEKSVKADSVVMWKGLRPRMAEAEAFFDSADEVLLLGDCTGRGGTLQRTFRSAFFTASQV